MVKSAVNVVFGTATFGYDTTVGMSTSSDKVVLQSILDEFKRRGYNELDNARAYGSGTSEVIFADVGYEKQGLITATKVVSFSPGSHKATEIHKSVEDSLQALKTNKVHILYLHSPDRSVPFEETVAAINEEYKKGRFEHFGLSNYTAEEVEQIVKISTEKGYVKPTVYQGCYNVLVRGGEEKLFPVLRKNGISFYAYSPLAGGFLTDDTNPSNQTGRFDNSHLLGQLYIGKFHKESHFKALEVIKAAAKKHNFTVSEVAFRWLAHHSQLKRAYNDAIIIGASKIHRAQAVLDDLEKPALPADVIKAVDEAWELVKHDASPYHN